jgi:Phosphotransferase enzyme family
MDLRLEEASGREVAVKIELFPGALTTERRALEWLGLQGGPAPLLRTASSLASTDGKAQACLVCDRARGEHPTSPAGWDRLGRALARLSQLPWDGSGLSVQAHSTFLAAHDSRIRDLDKVAGRDCGGIPWPSAPAGFFELPLVLTHGDPGPGNYLDDGFEGTIIDWEDAHIAPCGLDLARAIFIALVGSGPEGYVGQDHASRARSVVAGFSGGTELGAPLEGEMSWWLSVAGAQFAHSRLMRAGEPGVLPWDDALTVLDGLLTGSSPATFLTSASRPRAGSGGDVLL